MDAFGYFSYLGINCIFRCYWHEEKMWGKGKRIKRYSQNVDINFSYE